MLDQLCAHIGSDNCVVTMLRSLSSVGRCISKSEMLKYEQCVLETVKYSLSIRGGKLTVLLGFGV